MRVRALQRPGRPRHRLPGHRPLHLHRPRRHPAGRLHLHRRRRRQPHLHRRRDLRHRRQPVGGRQRHGQRRRSGAGRRPPRGRRRPPSWPSTCSTTPPPPAAPGTVRVTALTSTGATDTAYRGTVRLTSTDPSATLPADYTFTAADNGRHDFPAVAFATAGAQTVDAADTADAARRGSDTVYVYPAAATYLEVQVFSSEVTAGHPVTLRIRARNANGDIDTGYRGTVHLDVQRPGGHPAGGLHLHRHRQRRPHLHQRGHLRHARQPGRLGRGRRPAHPAGRLGLHAGHRRRPPPTSRSRSSPRRSAPASRRPCASGPATRTATSTPATGAPSTSRRPTPPPACPADFTFTAGDHGDRTFTNGVTYNTPGSQSVVGRDTANANRAGRLGADPGPLHRRQPPRGPGLRRRHHRRPPGDGPRPGPQRQRRHRHRLPRHRPLHLHRPGRHRSPPTTPSPPATPASTPSPTG